MSSPYSYEPLFTAHQPDDGFSNDMASDDGASNEEPSDNIRLLTLMPGDFEDPLRCHLTVLSLGHCPYYEALSYVWGDPAIKRGLQVDWQELLITANLESALRYLRFAHKVRVVWVDAICS
jgi:hypothetical protein